MTWFLHTPLTLPPASSLLHILISPQTHFQSPNAPCSAPSSEMLFPKIYMAGSSPVSVSLLSEMLRSLQGQHLAVAVFPPSTLLPLSFCTPQMPLRHLCVWCLYPSPDAALKNKSNAKPHTTSTPSSPASGNRSFLVLPQVTRLRGILTPLDLGLCSPLRLEWLPHNLQTFKTFLVF